MTIPPDKLKHMAVGLLAGLFGAALLAILALLDLAPLAALPGGIAVASTVAGLGKEGADWADNRVQPGMHSVDPWDALATAAPGWLMAIGADQVIQRLGLLA